MHRSASLPLRPRDVPALLVAAVLSVTAARPAAGQDEPGVKLAIGDVGIGIGDVPRLDGIRVNFRDRGLELARGFNLTLWEPYDGIRGRVVGLAVGAPLTGAYDVSGLAVAGGLAVQRHLDGAAIGLLGVGVGARTRGVMLGGLGAGTGEDLIGVVAGGLGVGAGENIHGLALGGLGAGAGGDVIGVAAGGLGIGAGGDVIGIAAGGLGVGAGGDLTGLALAGLGVGVGGRLTGLTAAGVGIGASEIRGIAVGGVGVGAGDLTGVAIGGLAAGVGDGRGLVIAPAYFRVDSGGSFQGVSVSAVHDVRGVQRGVAIGIVNIAGELHGLQVGLLNIARNKRSYRVLPFFNYSP